MTSSPSFPHPKRRIIKKPHIIIQFPPPFPFPVISPSPIHNRKKIPYIPVVHLYPAFRSRLNLQSEESNDGGGDDGVRTREGTGGAVGLLRRVGRVGSRGGRVGGGSRGLGGTGRGDGLADDGGDGGAGAVQGDVALDALEAGAVLAAGVPAGLLVTRFKASAGEVHRLIVIEAVLAVADAVFDVLQALVESVHLLRVAVRFIGSASGSGDDGAMCFGGTALGGGGEADEEGDSEGRELHYEIID